MRSTRMLTHSILMTTDPALWDAKPARRYACDGRLHITTAIHEALS
jgi:hypothetical protein